jgi:hypothetical protein
VCESSRHLTGERSHAPSSVLGDPSWTHCTLTLPELLGCRMPFCEAASSSHERWDTSLVGIRSEYRSLRRPDSRYRSMHKVSTVSVPACGFP